MVLKKNRLKLSGKLRVPSHYPKPTIHFVDCKNGKKSTESNNQTKRFMESKKYPETTDAVQPPCTHRGGPSVSELKHKRSIDADERLNLNAALIIGKTSIKK